MFQTPTRPVRATKRKLIPPKTQPAKKAAPKAKPKPKPKTIAVPVRAKATPKAKTPAKRKRTSDDEDVTFQGQSIDPLKFFSHGIVQNTMRKVKKERTEALAKRADQAFQSLTGQKPKK